MSAETVIERRALIAGGVGRWFRSITPELCAILATSIGDVSNDLLRRASATIFVTDAVVPIQDEWLCNEVMAARTRREQVRFVLFADAAGTRLVEEATRQFLIRATSRLPAAWSSRSQRFGLS